MYKNAKRPRQYSNRSKAAVQVVDMAATIHMVPPTRASTLSDHRYPYTLCISIKSSDDDHADAVLDIYPEHNLKSWAQQRRGLDVGIRLEPHTNNNTPILKNNYESYLQMCRIKGALLISRYTAGQD